MTAAHGRTDNRPHPNPAPGRTTGAGMLHPGRPKAAARDLRQAMPPADKRNSRTSLSDLKKRSSFPRPRGQPTPEKMSRIFKPAAHLLDVARGEIAVSSGS